MQQKLNRILGGVALICTVLFAACGTESSPASTTTSAAVSTTEQVLDRHGKTFGAGDLEGVMADYAPDAVMFTPGGPIKGTDALRKNFQTVLAEWTKPGGKFDLKKRIVEGENAYMYWNAETADNIYEGATDSFVIRNGKIVAHFFAGKITPK